MFEIKVKFDLTGSKAELDNIPKKREGVYVLFNAAGKALYVGIASNLRTRVRGHFTGATNTNRFSNQFHSWSLIFEPNRIEKETLEFFLIQKLIPSINISKKYRSLSPEFEIDLNNYRCKGITVSGETCKARAHTNGFWRLHGGNGVTISSVLNEAAKKALLSLDISFNK